MEKAVIAVVAFAVLVFASPLIGVSIGAFAGWVVGFFFADTIIGGLGRIGIDTAGLQVWQVGALLGFVGSFFHRAQSSKST